MPASTSKDSGSREHRGSDRVPRLLGVHWLVDGGRYFVDGSPGKA